MVAEFSAESVVCAAPHLKVLLLTATPKHGAEIRFVPDVDDHGLEHTVLAHVGDYVVEIVVPVGPAAVVARVRG